MVVDKFWNVFRKFVIVLSREIFNSNVFGIFFDKLLFCSNKIIEVLELICGGMVLNKEFVERLSSLILDMLINEIGILFFSELFESSSENNVGSLLI